MIDLILNERGGLTLAHDERAVDGYDSIEVSTSTGKAVLVGSAGRRVIGRLAPSMMSVFSSDMSGRSIRMAGWRLAKISPLAVDAVN